jgi:ABC-type amino acid transport substrate-binding protein
MSAGNWKRPVVDNHSALEALAAAGDFLRQIGRSLGSALSFGHEVAAQTEKVDASLQATRDTVGEDAAQRTADQLRTEILGQATRATEDVARQMDEIVARIEQRADEASRIVQQINRIGNTIRMLSLNATIEAARAGEHGRGFAVVANEVRALANQVNESAEHARSVVDFTDVKASLAGFREATEQSLGSLSAGLSRTADRMESLFKEVGHELGEIAGNNRAIHEAVTALQSSVARAENKSARAQAFTQKAGAATDASAPRIFAEAGVPFRDDGFDLLDDVLRRSMLRVAVEPAFVGLSFRQRPQEPLAGLDIAYAEAFARWLGVGIAFIETQWDACTELLDIAADGGEPVADLVWSALPPNAGFGPIAYSSPYTYLDYVLVRRSGDRRMNGLADLEGRNLGVINDPSAFATLEAAGVRWSENAGKGGRVVARLRQIVAFTDQGRIHDAIADGVVDAFAVDQPIMHWAQHDPASRWHGRLDILPGNLAADPWYYAVGVSGHPSSYRLLNAVNAFLAWFRQTPERKAIEQRWQGMVVAGHKGYQDEGAGLLGEAELRMRHAAMGGDGSRLALPGPRYTLAARIEAAA